MWKKLGKERDWAEWTKMADFFVHFVHWEHLDPVFPGRPPRFVVWGDIHGMDESGKRRGAFCIVSKQVPL